MHGIESFCSQFSGLPARLQELPVLLNIYRRIASWDQSAADQFVAMIESLIW